jgi:O-antigen/teichoic acid export membrane protein
MAQPPTSVLRPLPIVLIRAIVARFVLFGLNGLTGVITARTLDPAGRGELAAMIIWPVLLAALTTLGLPGALIYHVRRNPNRTSPWRCLSEQVW